MNVSSIQEFSRLGPDQLNDSVIEIGRDLINEHLKTLGRPGGESYESAVMAAMHHNPAFFLRINPNLISQGMVEAMNPIHIPSLINKIGAKAYDMVTQAQIDRAIHDDINLITGIDSRFISDELLKSVITEKPKRSAAVVEAAGRRNVIDELVSAGFWPHRESDVPRKPGCIADVIKLRGSKKWDSNHRMWLNALIRSYPESEVFPLMKTNARRKILVDVYDRDLLLNDHKSDKQLMGILLHDELGI